MGYNPLISNIFSLIQVSVNPTSLSILSKMSHLSNIFKVSTLFSLHQDYDSYFQEIFSSVSPSYIE